MWVRSRGEGAGEASACGQEEGGVGGGLWGRPRLELKAFLS